MRRRRRRRRSYRFLITKLTETLKVKPRTHDCSLSKNTDF